jgi:uncharacterized membrane protein YGL010W
LYVQAPGLVVVAGVAVGMRFFHRLDAPVGIAAGSVLKLHGGVIDAVVVQQVVAYLAQDAIAL